MRIPWLPFARMRDTGCFDAATTVALLVVGLAPSAPVQQAIASLKAQGLNAQDAERSERGYYESLIDAGRRLDQVGDDVERTLPLAQAKYRIPFDRDPRVQSVDDLREYALKPGYAQENRRGRWSNNSRGLRDREYDPIKPPKTFRIALLGDSIGAGWGVDDAATFESRLEALMTNRARERHERAVEIWNYSVPGYAPGQRWENFLRRDGWSTDVDAVVYEATVAEPSWDERRLRVLLPKGIGWDAPQYQEVLAGLRRSARADGDMVDRYLREHRWDLLESVYRTIARECKLRGVRCYWVLVPRVGRAADAGDRKRLLELARRCGFTAVIDVSDAFEGVDRSALEVAADDYHPNAEGHALIARRIDEALATRADFPPTSHRPGREESDSASPGDRP